MLLHWRQGLSGATARERWSLLRAEHEARQISIGVQYQERCDALDTILVDAHDLDVRSSRISWARGKGYLWVVVTVYHRSAGGLRDFRWRIPVSRRSAEGKHLDA